MEPVLPVLQHHVAGGVKSAGDFCGPVFPVSQAKEMDYFVIPCPQSDGGLKDSNGKIRVLFSKPVQKKLQQREMELLRIKREKESKMSLNMPTQIVDPEDAVEESAAGFVLPPVNKTVSTPANVSNAHREHTGTALRKRVNRILLPNVPIINEDGSFPPKSSANSLPPIAPKHVNWGEDPECGNDQESRPFSYPQQELLNALTWLSSDDWEEKVQGLYNIRRLAVCHSEVLLSRLHDVSLAVTTEVNSLRSKVSRLAIFILGELFRTMKKHMDDEVDEAARVLLQKMGDSNEFIQKASTQSLEIMVGSVTPARAKAALMASAVRHPNALVRKCAAEHLLTVLETIGAKKLLSGKRDSVDLLVGTLVKLAKDCHPDTRYYGRKMLNILASHEKFGVYLKQSVPSRDLQDVLARIKQKGIEDPKCECLPDRDSRRSRNNNLVKPQHTKPSAGGWKSDSGVRHQPVRLTLLQTVEGTEQLNELYKLLSAKEFQTRMEGVVLLLDYCKRNCHLISTNIVQVFDFFVPRLRDCNKKVKQKALEVLALMMPLLENDLHPVLVSLVEAVIENLNSKQVGIYAAAVKALDASMAHLDNTLLLQTFAHRVRYLSGQALMDVAERLSVLVASVHPQKPKAVERCVLPVLCFFLGHGVLPGQRSHARAAATKLAKSLYQVMGSRLKNYGKSQPVNVVKNLWDILELNVQ